MTFIDRPWVRNIVPLIDQYSLVVVTHPGLIRYLFPGPFNGWEKMTYGWWKKNNGEELKFYSTSQMSLLDDLKVIVRRYENYPLMVGGSEGFPEGIEETDLG